MRCSPLLAFLATCVVACQEATGIAPPPRDDLFVDHGDLGSILERGQLRVLAPALSSENPLRGGGAYTRERELVAEFAERMGIRAEIIAVERRSDLFELLAAGYGDLVVAQMTVTEPRRERFRFTRPTEIVSEWVVGRKGEDNLPRRLESLRGRSVHVRASSAFAETLRTATAGQDLDIDIVYVEESIDTEEIAYEVSRGKRPLTIVDSNLLEEIESYNPHLERLFELAAGREIAWVVRKEATELAAAADAFVIEHVLTEHRTEDHSTGDLDAIRERGSLRMITMNNPVHFFVHRGRPMGFDYEIGKLAADRLGVRLELVVPDSRDLVFDWLLEGRGDVIGSTLTVTPGRQERLSFSAPYLFIEEMVVQATDAESPVSEEADLVGRRVYAWESSSHFQTLERVREVVGPFDIVPVPEDIEFDAIVDRVADGTFPLAVVDSHVLQAELSFRSDVVGAFSLSSSAASNPNLAKKLHTVRARDAAVAYAVRRDNPELLTFLNEFVADIRGSLELNDAVNRYFRQNRALPRVKERRAAISQRLSPYDEIFKAYAKRYGLDWRLMVAQAYQESRFDPNAESWAGAVGIFQLLPSTGNELGFHDLEDPKTGIHAGIKYMHLLVERLSRRIPLKHRLRFALAAYNAGYGHVQDARRLATEKGWDSTKWFGHTERAMLLLGEPEFNRRARFGYVRGKEPVKYVSEIQNRYDHYVTLVPP